eukprot:2641260-Alexandrium_andersonii.AAC.1
MEWRLWAFRRWALGQTILQTREITPEPSEHSDESQDTLAVVLLACWQFCFASRLFHCPSCPRH